MTVSLDNFVFSKFLCTSTRPTTQNSILLMQKYTDQSHVIGHFLLLFYLFISTLDPHGFCKKSLTEVTSFPVQRNLLTE